MTKKFWHGLLLLLLIYSCYYLLFIDATYLLDIPRQIRHAIKLTTLVLVYLIGLRHLTTSKTYWMTVIWHIIHISGIILICLFGVYDLVFGILPIRVRWILDSVAEFLIAPSLYVGMGILQNFLLVQINNNAKKND